MEYTYEEEEASDVEADLRPVARRTAKHIAAGEERPRINSSQQTTPTDGEYNLLLLEAVDTGISPTRPHPTDIVSISFNVKAPIIEVQFSTHCTSLTIYSY